MPLKIAVSTGEIETGEDKKKSRKSISLLTGYVSRFLFCENLHEYGRIQC